MASFIVKIINLGGGGEVSCLLAMKAEKVAKK